MYLQVLESRYELSLLWLNWPKYGIYGIFSDFWLLSLRAKFRGYRVPDLPFSARNIKIQCLEHLWVPWTHCRNIRAYPLKMASKFKTGDFQVKKYDFLYLLVLFGPECPWNSFQTYFANISTQSHLSFYHMSLSNEDKTAGIWHFWMFLVISSDFWFQAKFRE